MSLAFQARNETAQVTVNGLSVILTDDQVTEVWHQTADLYDDDHFGPANILLGSRVVTLHESQWQSLYTHASAYIEREFWAEMLEENVLH